MCFLGLRHVAITGCDVDDTIVWEFAKSNGFTIVSKDADFHHLSFMAGCAAAIIWMDVGNCSTSRIESIIRTNVLRIIAFHREEEAAFLILR